MSTRHNNVKKNNFYIILSKGLNVVIFILFIVDIILIIFDFDKFTIPSGVGYCPTNRVGMVTGIMIFFVGIQYLCSYHFGYLPKFPHKLFKWIKQSNKTNKKISLLTGIISIVLGLWSFITGLLGLYN